MKLKEIIVESKLNEYGSQYSDYQKVSAKDVKTAKNNFIANFKQQVKLNKKAGTRTEVINRLANSYMKKYGVSDAAITDAKFQNLVQQAGAETGFLNPALNELINYMYFLASTTVQSDTGNQANMQGTGRNTSGSPPSGRIAPTTKQIIKIIKKYTNEDDLDDLAKIAKTAMQVLYSQDPDSYTKLYNEITAGRVSPATASQGAFNQMSNQLSGRP
jgi:hypothetical protein